MPKDLKDFPRPPSDNGRGLHGSASAGWSGGKEGYEFWVAELVALGVRWFKVLDAGGDSLTFCTKLLEAGIFPIVRIIRKDPPPNDSPEPNPGHINSTEEETIRRLIAAGVRYIETNNEPNLETEWKNGAMPGDAVETAKLVALNWLFDARFILAAGGYPGLPAVSSGGSMDLMGALVALGRQDILLEGCWVALHNYCQNRPLDYPDDPINRAGQALAPAQFELGAYTQWAWWNNAAGHSDTLDDVNALRVARKSPSQTLQQEHACFREFEYYNTLAMKYLGRSIPIISTEGGYSIGRREDTRYSRVTPEAQRDLTVAMFDYMQRQAPDYYFAAVPSMMIETQDWESTAWYSTFWKRTLQKSAAGRDGMPTIPVPGVVLGDRLPIVDAVKAMPNLARRLPGAQPAPPAVQAAVSVPPPKAAPLKYVVMPGDTLSKIAKQFGTSWQQIASANQLGSPDVIHAGQTLMIPRLGEGKPAQEPSPATDAAAQEAPQRPTETRAPRPRPGLAALLAESESTPVASTPTKQTPPVVPVAPAPPSAIRPDQTVTTPPPPVPSTPPPGQAAPSPTAPAEFKPVQPPPAPRVVPSAPPPTQAAPSPTAPAEFKPVQPAPAPRVVPTAPPQPPSAPQRVPPPPPAVLKPVAQPPATPQRVPPPPPPLDLESMAPPKQVQAGQSPVHAPAPTPSSRLAPPPKLPDFAAAPPVELEWDWRLDALGVGLEHAQVEAGKDYWRLIKAVYQAPDESGDGHQIHYTLLDELGQPVQYHKVWQGWPTDKTDALTNERGETSIPLWESYAPDRGESGVYYAWVDGLPTDRVYGMGLPLKRHVNFLLTWQRTAK